MANGKHEATETPNNIVPSPAIRKYIYGVLVAAAAVGVIYGIVNVEQVGVWLVLGAAILGLGNGLALTNTPKSPSDPNNYSV